MKSGIKMEAFVYWIITVIAVNVLLNAGVLDARTTRSNLRELAGIPNGIIPKTSFTCRGKDAGYYADIETDCQIYHLCDEQGRQYSYACPNATLFQQRMLICDHWYMVDCSAAEASYGFNRLIGQRDQPFVSQSDAEKRTPRPDILDRPYAPDYGGESFRKQLDKSQIPALQNAISGLDLSKNQNKKYEILETEASSNILPPQIDSNSLDPTLLPASEDFPQYDKTNDRRAAFSAESEEIKPKGFNPPPTGFEPPKLLPTYNDQFRKTEERRLRDLGVPTQPTRTKNSQSFSPIQNVAQGTKKPSKTFDPDKNFAAFDHFFPTGKATYKDYDFSKYLRRDQIATTRKPTTTTRRPVQNNKFQLIGPPATQRPAPFVNKNNNLLQKAVTTTTTRRPAFATTTVANVARVIATTKTSVTAKQTFTTTKKPSQVTRQPAFFNNQLTQPARAQIQKQQQPALNKKPVIVPATDLLPPLEVVKLYDDATTRGPPVYFDWKLPDNGLVPPKFDNETETNSLKRSVLEEGNFDGSNDFQSSETRRTGTGNSIKIQYKDLQRYFAIPQVEFPLESTGRDGYEKDDAVNSFQVKIPLRMGNAKTIAAERYYYLEHGHCNPECHPYFFKPGRCEPCIKL